jgi:hypothetical protein
LTRNAECRVERDIFGSRLGTLAEAEAAGRLEGKWVFASPTLLTRADEVID